MVAKRSISADRKRMADTVAGWFGDRPFISVTLLSTCLGLFGPEPSGLRPD